MYVKPPHLNIAKPHGAPRRKASSSSSERRVGLPIVVALEDFALPRDGQLETDVLDRDDLWITALYYDRG